MALKKILMHHEKEGVCIHFIIFEAFSLNSFEQFPITAIREIKLLKALSHPNILQLREMAVERSKGKIKLSCRLHASLPDILHRRRAEKAQHVYGHAVYGARPIGTSGEPRCSVYRTPDQMLLDAAS